MPKATATVNGHTVAETDSYELVEGNIYVRTPVPIHHPFPLSAFLHNPSSRPPPSTKPSSRPHPQQRSAHTRAQRPTTPSQRTRRKPKTRRGCTKIRRRSLRRLRDLWRFIRVSLGLRSRASKVESFLCIAQVGLNDNTRQLR
jgi:hypothetical protein